MVTGSVLSMPIVFHFEGLDLDFVELDTVRKVGLVPGLHSKLLEDSLASGQLLGRLGYGFRGIGIIVTFIGGNLGQAGLELARQHLKLLLQEFKVRLFAHEIGRAHV